MKTAMHCTLFCTKEFKSFKRDCTYLVVGFGSKKSDQGNKPIWILKQVGGEMSTCFAVYKETINRLLRSGELKNI